MNKTKTESKIAKIIIEFNVHRNSFIENNWTKFSSFILQPKRELTDKEIRDFSKIIKKAILREIEKRQK
jgi:hypothetical protein